MRLFHACSLLLHKILPMQEFLAIYISVFIRFPGSGMPLLPAGPAMKGINHENNLAMKLIHIFMEYN